MIYKDESVFVGDRIATWMFYVSCTEIVKFFAIFQNDNFDAFEGWKVGYIGQGDQECWFWTPCSDFFLFYAWRG